MKTTEWKVNQWEWVTIKGFIEVMKKYEPQFKEWNLSLGDPVNNPEDGSFNRLVYIDGKPVKVEPIQTQSETRITLVTDEHGRPIGW